MLNLTFDMNCLIALENNEADARNLHRLISLHDSDQILISVPGIQASEKLKDGSFAHSFSEFQTRVGNLSSKPFEILKSPLYLDLAYLDWAILGSDKGIELESNIHQVLFPHHYFLWKDQAEASGVDPNTVSSIGHDVWIKWRNRKCDTLALWCHIHYEKDIFVTNDSNFHLRSKKSKLEAIGAKNIARQGEIIV